MSRDLTLIVGHGRSGTNWLMDILDANPATFCRSEPNVLEGSPFLALPAPWLPQALQAEALERGWDAAVAWAGSHVGARDHAPAVAKHYLHETSRRLGLTALPQDGRWRKALALAFPRFRSREWTLPAWLGSQQAMVDAPLVLKLNKASGWAAWVLEHRPEARVIHIVRHPGGRLNSWRHRYLARHDAETVLQRNRERLGEVAKASPEWAARLTDVDEMGLAESETWFWRYVSELLHGAAEGHPRYRCVVYERLVADPVATGRELYDFCGLDWTEHVETWLRARHSESRSIASAWREKLAPEDVAVVDRVLAGSPLKGFWE